MIDINFLEIVCNVEDWDYGLCNYLNYIYVKNTFNLEEITHYSFFKIFKRNFSKKFNKINLKFNLKIYLWLSSY